MKSLLELLPLLAVDTASDFLSVFPDILNALLEIINPQQTTMTSLIFHSLALIFKYQNKRLIQVYIENILYINRI